MEYAEGVGSSSPYNLGITQSSTKGTELKPFCKHRYIYNKTS